MAEPPILPVEGTILDNPPVSDRVENPPELVNENASHHFPEDSHHRNNIKHRTSNLKKKIWKYTIMPIITMERKVGNHISGNF